MLASAVRLEANTTSVMPGCFLHPSRLLYFWLGKDSSWDSQSSSLQKQACLFSYADFTLQRGPHHSPPLPCAIQPFPPAPSLPIQQCLAPLSVSSASCLCCCLSQIAIFYVRFDSFPCLDALLNLRPALMSALSWPTGLIGPSLKNWECSQVNFIEIKYIKSKFLTSFPLNHRIFFLSVKMLWVFQGRQSCLRPET